MGVSVGGIVDFLGGLFASGAGEAAAADVGAAGIADAAATGIGAGLGGAATGAALDATGAAALGDLGTAAALGGAAGAGASALGGATAGATDIGGASALGSLGGGAALGAGDALPTVTVTGAAPAAGGGGLGALGFAAPGAASMLLPSIAGGEPTPAQIREKNATAAPGQTANTFLPATTAADTQSIGDTLQNLLGLEDQISGAGGASGSAFGDPSLTDITFDPNSVSLGADAVNSPGILDWFSNPKNLATAGLLGISAGNILNPPKIPSQARLATGTAAPVAQQAQAVIASGGTAAPIWSQQKASIDSSIDQQIQQQTEALMQAAANSGMSGANGVPTGVVQQQISTMTANLNTQRQQLYMQALQQNVNNAVSELTGSNATLMNAAQLQYQEDFQAQQLALQAAALAAKLYSLSG